MDMLTSPRHRAGSVVLVSCLAPFTVGACAQEIAANAAPLDGATASPDAGALACRDPAPLPAAITLDLTRGGTTCETATLAPLASELTFSVSEASSGESVRWVRVRVDRHQTLLLDHGGGSGTSAGIALHASCTGEPIASRDTGLTRTQNIRWWRDDNGPAEVFVRFRYSATMPSGPHAFILTRFNEPPHASCECARPLDGSPLAAQDLPNAVTRLAIPVSSAYGNYGLHYALTVPAGHQLVARATRLRFGSTATLSAHPSCNLLQRYEYTTTPPRGGYNEFNWSSIRMAPTTDAARPVVLVLSTNGLDLAAPNDLRVSVVPVAPNASCDTARAVTDGAVLPNEDLAGASARVVTCEESAYPYPSPALVYRIRVSARRRLRVQAEGVDLPPSERLFLRVFDRCGAAQCLARSADRSSSVTFENTSDAAREVFVSLSDDIGDPAPLGRVRLAFTSEPL